MRHLLHTLAFLTIGTAAIAAPSFDEQRKAVSTGIVTQPENAIIALLKAGEAENTFSQAHSVAKGWFQQNQPEKSETLLLAARVAENSAHYNEAVAFYQQYLQIADLKTKASEDAVMHLYHLMIDVLNNKNNSAIFYILANGDRFVHMPRVRQFNTWVLDKLNYHHEDFPKFIKQLINVSRSVKSKEELTTIYAKYYRKAMFPDRRFVGNYHRSEDIAMGKLYVELGKAITHDEWLKHLFIWRGKVWAYNASLKANIKPIPRPPIAEAEALLDRYPECGAMVWQDLIIDERQARDVLMRKEYDPDAKIALIKKYLPKMKPLERYKVLRILKNYDKDIVTGKERAMLSPMDRRKIPKGTKFMTNKDPEPVRLKEYRTLLADFDSPNPKLPAVYDRLVTVLGCTPSVWSDFLSKNDPKREWIFYRTVTEKVRISPDRFNVAVPWGNKPPHWAEPHLRAIVSDQADKKTITPWLLMTWINSYRGIGFKSKDHSDPAGYPLMDKIQALAAYKKLPNDLREYIRIGAAEVFEIPSELKLVKTPKGLKFEKIKVDDKNPPSPRNEIFKEVVALQKDVDAETLAKALRTGLQRMEAEPNRTGIFGDGQFLSLNIPVFSVPRHKQPTAKAFNDPAVINALLDIISSPSASRTRYVRWNEGLYHHLIASLSKSKDLTVIHRHADVLWWTAQFFNYGNRSTNRMLAFQQSVFEASPSAAATLARASLNYYSERQEVNPLSTTLINRANQAMKLSTIAVDESDPNFPVYKSQSEFVGGNFESAWKLFEEHSENAVDIHRQLSSDYLLWVLGRLIDQRETEKQEVFARLLKTWRSESTSAFTKSQAIRLDILIGDIARQLGKLDDAHKIYRSIQSNKSYAGVQEIYQATLKQIDIERITKNFPAALETVNRLIAKKVPELWAEARYAKAEIFYDQEDYDEAAELVEAILKSQPGHKDATILDGRIKNKLKDLIGASEIEIGSTTQQSKLVPGEELKVTLNDPSLAVGNAATDIEVIVWSESKDGTRGDEELVMLRPFGDSKTKFRGTVPVRLGAIKKNDMTLQVVGDDRVYFSYSDRFRKKVGDIKEWKGGPLSIVSDSTLMASARTLLSLAEQKAADAELLLSKIKVRNLSALDPAERERVEKDIEKEAEKQRLQARVKPGNPIYLRVVDKDRSRTPGVDTLTVSATSSSGDTVSRIELKETGTHTGIFETVLSTSEAQAMAFATSTRTGLNPNMVISPKTYPAWRSAVGKGKGSAVFTVDLNDNVELDTLKISVTEEGMALKKFRLTAGMNRRDLQPVATWPKTPASKNPLEPSIFIVQQGKSRTGYGNPAESRPFDANLLSRYLSQDYLRDFPGAHTEPVKGISQAFGKHAYEQTSWVKEARHQNSVRQVLATRFRAYFYEEQDVDRHFRVVFGKSPKYVIQRKVGKHNAKWDLSGKVLPAFVLINGRPLKNEGLTYTGAFRLQEGLQRIEILSQGRAGAIGFGRTCKLQTRQSEEEEWVDCDDTMFDDSTFPKQVRDRAVPPAEIAINNDGTEWTVKFEKGSRARVLSIDLLEHQGPEAALNKLRLTNVEGKIVLPVPEDFSEQTKNNTLEILTGDRVWIRYMDDRFTAKRLQKQERVLQVAFTDSRVHFSDVEPVLSQKTKKLEPNSEPILRYEIGKPLSVVVDDPDMDSAEGQDSLEVTLTAGNTRKTFIATEMTIPPGRFRVFVTPTTGPGTGKNELKVSPGDTIELSYFDEENNSPGVPANRKTTIRHAKYEKPRLLITNTKAIPYVPTEYEAARDRARQAQIGADGDSAITPESTELRLVYEFVDAASPEAESLNFVLGAVPRINIIAPHLMLRKTSFMSVFIQTEGDRKRAAKQGRSLKHPFDVTIPGTRMLKAFPPRRGDEYGKKQVLSPIFSPPKYTHYSGPGAEDSLFYGRIELNTDFTPPPGELVSEDLLLKVATPGIKPPMTAKERQEFHAITDSVPSYRQKADYQLTRCRLFDKPVVAAGDKIHIGLRYADEAGKTHWLTATAKISTYGQMEATVQSGKYRAKLEDASLGDRVRVDVFDLGYDTSDELDDMTVSITSKSGKDYPLTLKETEGHSGIFQGSFLLAIARDNPPAEEEAYNINTMGFPAKYGDTITIHFTDSGGRKLPPKTFTLGVGADGNVEAFTKRYADDGMAAKTQFAMAEAYLEVAKRYHKLKAHKESKLAFQSAKRMLVSTLDRFTDSETRAHAEYLLGNLTYEEANNTEEKDLAEERYQAALARFQKVTSDYPQTLFASKAQFKKAVVYERLNEPNVAAQEYVKLAYRFPESEHLAVALARLGIYFLKNGGRLEKQSKALLAKADDKDAQFNGNKLHLESQDNYEKSGKIFERLLERFPNHELAPKAGLLSGKAYMRINRYRRALDLFKAVKDEEAYEGVARAEAMYWAGKCFNTLNQYLAAYAVFMRCTTDYPETKWSGFSLSELAQPRLKKIDKEYELNRVEKGLMK